MNQLSRIGLRGPVTSPSRQRRLSSLGLRPDWPVATQQANHRSRQPMGRSLKTGNRGAPTAAVRCWSLLQCWPALSASSGRWRCCAATTVPIPMPPPTRLARLFRQPSPPSTLCQRPTTSRLKVRLAANPMTGPRRSMQTMGCHRATALILVTNQRSWRTTASGRPG